MCIYVDYHTHTLKNIYEDIYNTFWTIYKARNVGSSNRPIPR